MNTLERSLVRATLLALTIFLALATFEVWRVGEAISTSAAATTGAIQDVDTAVRFVSRPCTARDEAGKLQAPGVFCNLDKLTKSLQGVAVDTRLQVQQSGQLIQATTGTMRSAAADLHATAGTLQTQLGQVGPLLASVRQSTDEIPQTMRQLQATLQPIPQLLADTDATVKHMDARVADPSNAQLQANLAGSAANLEKISGDFYARLHPMLNPDPCTTRSCRARTAFTKVGAAFPLLEAVYDVQRIWAGPNQNVKVALTPSAPQQKKNRKNGGRKPAK